jgi:hypothetical protein
MLDSGQEPWPDKQAPHERFRKVLDELELKKLHLHGRKFTWSSGTTVPTQTKIDHIFLTKEWELFYPHCHLQALASSVSDHCPMLLTSEPFTRRYRGFRFEAFWLKLPEFKQIVADSWAVPVSATNKARVLHTKLARLAKVLKHWNKKNVFKQ